MTEHHTVDFTPTPQSVQRNRGIITQSIQSYREELVALNVLWERTCLVPELVSFRAYGAIRESLKDWVEEKKETMTNSLLMLEWGIKEIDDAATIRTGPHYKVGYAFPGHAFEYEYIPATAVQHFGGISEAFFALTGRDEELDLDIDEEGEYTANGELWEEKEDYA